MDNMVVYTTQGGVPGGGSPVPRRGLLGSLALGIASVVGLILFVGVLLLIVGLFAAAVVVAVVAIAVNRLLMAISPGYRDRRVAQGTFRPTSKVIEATAKVIDSTKPRRK
jgi:hypothetical protein